MIPFLPDYTTVALQERHYQKTAMKEDFDSYSDSNWMNYAVEQAQIAATSGEIPVGAVIIHEDRILATGHNQKETNENPTAHAEIIAIQQAAKYLETWRLTHTTLYVTLEPCCMCIGAVMQARIPRVVFGAYDPKSGACGSLLNIPGEHRLNHRVLVAGGILEQPCGEILQSFFQRRRQQIRDLKLVS